MELATGIALWASPPQIKIPGMLALAALRGIRAKLRERDEESSPGGNNSDGSHSKDEVVVRWDDVRMTLQPTKKDKKKLGADAKPKRILDGVSGTAKPGRLLAIMGPSGAGKTTLLNMLTCEDVGGTPVGKVTINGQPLTSKLYASHCAYVRQTDTLWPYLTPREYIQMASRMYGTGTDENDHVENMLKSVGLIACQDTKVGGGPGGGKSGLSGGQKRRLSLALHRRLRLGVEGEPRLARRDRLLQVRLLPLDVSVEDLGDRDRGAAPVDDLVGHLGLG